MTRVSKNIRIYVFSSLLLTLISTLLFSFAYLFNFDSVIGYFNSSSFVPRWATLMTVLTFFWILTSLVAIKKGELRANLPPSSTGSNIFAGISFTGFSAYSLYRLFMNRTVETVPQILSNACILFGALSSIYFLLVALKKKDSSGLIFSGFAPIFWAALSMTEVYVNKNIAMNNPIKISYMMAMMSFMLFISFELRFRLERGMPRLYLIFSLIGVLVSSIYVLPFATLALTDKYLLASVVASSCVSLALTGYMLFRVFDFLSHQIFHTSGQTQ